MTDSLTRAAATRWHHGAPGAAVALRAAGGARDLPAALHVRWPRELPGPRPPAIRVRGSGLAVWDPGPRVSFEKRRDRPARRVCGDCTETMRRGGEGALSVISRISWTTDRNSRRRSYACGLRPSTSRRCSSNRAARGRTAPSHPSPARGGMNCWTARSSTHARKPRS